MPKDTTRRKHKQRLGVDLISSFPDEILHRILSFMETRLAIRTSVLSKRWRHLWSETPSLIFDWSTHNLEAGLIYQILANNKAPKMRSFQLCSTRRDHIRHIDRWIEFAMSRNVENISLNIKFCGYNKYTIPDFFYTSSSLKQLRVDLGFLGLMIPSRPVSWTSLKKLSLGSCQLSDEIFANILSGCPILESLRLFFCDRLKVLDLTESLHLRTLEVYQGSMEIVAPHIRCLNLTNSGFVPCSLVDVSSLKKARLDIHFCLLEQNMKSDLLQWTLLSLLEKLENVEKLTLGRTYLEILSLAELRGATFPSLKVKDLTVETVVCEYVIPGLDKDKKHHGSSLQYLSGFSSRAWRSKMSVFKNISARTRTLKREHIFSFIKLMLESTKSTLEKMVLVLDGYVDRRRFEELLDIVHCFPRDTMSPLIVLIR